MIVPSPRFVWWSAMLVIPCSTLAVALPQTAPFAGVVVLGFLLLIFADALKSHSLLQGIGIELPPVIRLVHKREGTALARLVNPHMKQRVFRLGMDADPSAGADEEMRIESPADTEFSAFEWKFVPAKRGRFSVDHMAFETLSHLGFWLVRAVQPGASEIRVYPNLVSERRSVTSVFLKRGLPGRHVYRQIGKGREFEKLREYVSGDNFEDIHWKATAKRGRPITKVFQIERTREIYVVVDTSRLTGRLNRAADGDGLATTLERYITAALVLGLAAEKQGDLFGLLTFSDKVDNFVRARNGKAHYSVIRDRLYSLEPREVSPDFDELFTFLRLRLRRRALVVVLTALDDPILSEQFAKSMALVSKQHLVLANMIIPSGVQPVFSDEISNVSELYAAVGGHLIWSQLRELQTTLGIAGVRLSLISNEQLAAELVSQYMEVKQRQIL